MSAPGLLGDGELAGEVAGVLYRDDASGFGVVELELSAGSVPEEADGDGGARCAGPLADLVAGQQVRMVGGWDEHPRYGWTFEATFYEQVTPATVEGLRSFLTSERFEGVADRTVTRVLSELGARAGTVIEQGPEPLADEAGISAEAAAQLHERWMAGRALAELVRLGEPAGLPMSVLRAVHARHGAEAVGLARDEPYELVAVPRCGFTHADRLARHLGVDADDPRRLSAGAVAAVAAARWEDGHEHLPRGEATAAAAGLLGVDGQAAARGLEDALGDGRLVADTSVTGDGAAAIYTAPARRNEQDLADELARLLSATSRVQPRAADAQLSGELTDGQAEATRAALRAPVTVLTGGPGTGKTRTIQELVGAAEAAELTVGLCAPTGRAAKRVEALAGRPASTVHRLLGARPADEGGFVFRYGPDERLPLDLVVCDEVSMCDSELAAQLAGAVDDGSHLALVGDPDQLPPVGPGDVLRDLLASDVVPSVRLTEMHRQAADSRIVALARAVNGGTVGELPGNDREQVFMAEERRRRVIVPRVVEAVAERVPDRLGIPPGDVQVLAPMYAGAAGVDRLNAALKETLNPDGGRPTVAGVQIGDRVMQTRNDAELGVSNGDVGEVTDLSVGDGTVRVAFPQGEVTYGADRAGQLTHAWAVTVHKSQGGEWPVVVLVVDRSHDRMLWRNLVYTAVTRATEALIVVGQADALRRAAGREQPRMRRTGLTARLEAALEP